jgi:hypothetical protein
MREQLEEWAKRLETTVVAERFGEKFSSVRRPGEYINLFGNGTMLEIVLERTVGTCQRGAYVRVIWKESHPKDKPFLYMRYLSTEFPVQPKTEFYLDQNKGGDLVSASYIEEMLLI